MLQETFIGLLRNYTNDDNLIREFWTEIEQSYSEKGRYYHTLQHLENLLTELIDIEHEIQNREVVLFALYYHDVVYRATKSDNEEKSAALAQKRMLQLAIPTDTIERCKKLILATQSHFIADDSDTNYFTDADLSVLGQNWERYSAYCENVRKEYAVYPDFVYNPGRKKVLRHFLTMDRIFKTELLYNKFEKVARQNIQKEIELL